MLEQPHNITIQKLPHMTGKGAVYTYDPVGSYERAGYGCDVSPQHISKTSHPYPLLFC